MGKWRLSSLDQCRGYAVVAMFLVNYAGEYHTTPAFLHHTNRNFGYPDSIMPLFFFCVGFAMRINLRPMRRLPYLRLLRRVVGLFAISFVLYVLIDQIASGWSHSWQKWLIRDLFQALATIAVVTVYLLPAIRLASLWLLAYVGAGACLYVGLSLLFYYDFAMSFPVIDGGPLGFLTWALPTAAGCWAWDVILMYKKRSLTRVRVVLALVTAGVWLMIVGYLVNCLRMLGMTTTSCYYPTSPCEPSTTLPPPPFIVPSGAVGIWDMGQRGSTVSYQLFSAGFSLLTYALFFVMCDWTNPLDPAVVEEKRKREIWVEGEGIELDVMETGEPGAVRKGAVEVVHEYIPEEEQTELEPEEKKEPGDDGKGVGHCVDGDATGPEEEELQLEGGGEEEEEGSLRSSDSEVDLVTIEQAEYPGMDVRRGTVAAQRVLMAVLEWLGIAHWGRWRLGLFTAFGSNALLAYIWQGLVIGLISLLTSPDMSAWLVWAVFAVFMLVSYALVKALHYKGWFLRV